MRIWPEAYACARTQALTRTPSQVEGRTESGGVVDFVGRRFSYTAHELGHSKPVFPRRDLQGHDQASIKIEVRRV